MLDVFKHLVPRTKTWALTINRNLRKFFEGLAIPHTKVVKYFDDIWSDMFPATTREAYAWELQFGLPTATSLTDAERITRLENIWSEAGGQDPYYLGGEITKAGFSDIYIYEWWLPGTDPPEAIDPAEIVGDPAAEYQGGYMLVNKLWDFDIANTMECGEPDMECGEPDAECGENTGLQFLRVQYNPPTNPAEWPYCVYVAGPLMSQLTLTAEELDRLEDLLLKIFPAHLWIGIVVASEASFRVTAVSTKQLLDDADLELTSGWAGYWHLQNSTRMSKQPLTRLYGAGDWVGSILAGSEDWSTVYQDILTPDDKYLLRMWANTDSYNELYIMDGGYEIGSTPSSGKWRRHQWSWTAQTTDLRFQGSNDKLAGLFRIDDLELYKYFASGQILADGDMEDSGTTSWPAWSGATVTKETTDPYGGVRCLRLTNVGVMGGARQSGVLGLNKTYKVTGWARSDGTAIPSVYFQDVVPDVWEGTTSTDWQQITGVVKNTGAGGFTLRKLAAGNYVEFDNIVCQECFEATIKLTVTSGNSVKINWGDGTIDDVTADGTEKTMKHAYITASDYEAKITGDLAGVTSLVMSDPAFHGDIWGLASMRNLTSIDIRNSFFTGDIGRLSGLANLTSLLTDNNQLDYDGVNKYGLPALVAPTLQFRHAEFTRAECDRIVNDLAASGATPGTLDITGNASRITDDSNTSQQTLWNAGWDILEDGETLKLASTFNGYNKSPVTTHRILNKYPLCAYKGDYPTVTSWPGAHGKGETLSQAGTGSNPVVGLPGPFTEYGANFTEFVVGKSYTAATSGECDITTEDFAIRVIVRTQKSITYQHFNNKKDGANAGWAAYTYNGNFRCYLTYSGPVSYVLEHVGPQKNAWYDYLVTGKYGDEARMYLNGKLVDTIDMSTVGSGSMTNSGKYSIGFRVDLDPTNNFGGAIAAAGFWANSDWLDSPDQLALSEELFLKLCGFYPSVMDGTAYPILRDRQSGACLEIYDEINDYSVLHKVAEDWPRLCRVNTPSGVFEGYLAEQQATNWIWDSEAFNGWPNTGITATDDDTQAPDTRTAAAKLVASSGSGTKFITYNMYETAGPMTFSVYAKPGNKDWVKLKDARINKGAWFDVTNGVIGNVEAGVTANISPDKYLNGFYRISITFLSDIDGQFDTWIQPVDANGGTTVTGDGSTTNTYVWGAQCEAGEKATSYIQTLGSAVTRLKDKLTYKGDDGNIQNTQRGQFEAGVFIPKINVWNYLVDGDMEKSGTTDWTAYQSGTLTKETGTPHGGANVLRVARNGVDNPGAYQQVLTSGRIYKLTGWCRGDGTAKPRVQLWGTVLWTGFVGTDWQYFSLVGVCGATGRALYEAVTSSGTTYAEYDDLRVIECLNSLADGDMEKSGVTDWTNLDSATLTKETGTPHGGTRCLRVTKASATAGVEQAILEPLQVYHVDGWVRSDGTSTPYIYVQDIGTVWTGTTSTSWQHFYFTFKSATSPSATDFRLYKNNSGNYVEWDDIIVVPIENVVENGRFERWASDDPVGWSVSAEDANKYVSASGGGARLYTTGDSMYFYQSCFSVGKKYRVSFDITTHTSGSVRLETDQGYTFGTAGAVGNYVFEGYPNSAILRFIRHTACDLIIDNVVAEEIPSKPMAMLTDGGAAADSIAFNIADKPSVVFKATGSNPKAQEVDVDMLDGEPHNVIVKWNTTKAYVEADGTRSSNLASPPVPDDLDEVAIAMDGETDGNQFEGYVNYIEFSRR